MTINEPAPVIVENIAAPVATVKSIPHIIDVYRENREALINLGRPPYKIMSEMLYTEVEPYIKMIANGDDDELEKYKARAIKLHKTLINDGQHYLPKISDIIGDGNKNKKSERELAVAEYDKTFAQRLFPERLYEAWTKNGKSRTDYMNIDRMILGQLIGYFEMSISYHKAIMNILWIMGGLFNIKFKDILDEGRCFDYVYIAETVKKSFQKLVSQQSLKRDSAEWEKIEQWSVSFTETINVAITLKEYEIYGYEVIKGNDNCDGVFTAIVKLNENTKQIELQAARERGDRAETKTIKYEGITLAQAIDAMKLKAGSKPKNIMHTIQEAIKRLHKKTKGDKGGDIGKAFFNGEKIAFGIKCISGEWRYDPKVLGEFLIKKQPQYTKNNPNFLTDLMDARYEKHKGKNEKRKK